MSEALLLLDELKKLYTKPDTSSPCLRIVAFKTGSRVICTNPAEDCDEDWFVLVPSIQHSASTMAELGFILSDFQEEYENFWSWRKGSLNFILMDDLDLYQRSKIATELAVRFKLEDKKDRIDLFNAIQYGILERS